MPGSQRTEKPEVGDLVQVEIDGALQLATPAKVRAVKEHEGDFWVFVENSEAGIPMEQVIVEQKAGSPARSTPPRLPLEAESRAGMLEETTSLDEGPARIVWPENLSEASVHDLEYWLEGILKKAKRRAGIA